MANPFYTVTGTPATRAPGASSPMRAEYLRIQAGFDKLPDLVAGKAVIVKADGTRLTTTDGALVLDGGFTLSGAHGVVLVAGAAVTLTLPLVSGTLATLAGTEILSNKTMVAPSLGTPTVLVGTNITGTAAGLTAGNVTTNASLTGPITSVGNSTSIAAQTGTGSTFVMQGSPTLTTPVLGAATATSINGLTLTSGTGTLTIANGASLVVAASKVATISNTLTLAGTDGKTLTVAKSLTLDGTDATTMTFPATSATIARTDAGQTFTGAQVFTSAVTLGTQQTTRGGLVLANTAAGSYAATLQSSNSATVATTITLPPDAGTTGYYLRTDGAGVTTWGPGTASYSLIESKTVSGTPSSVVFSSLAVEDAILYIVGLTITAGIASLKIEFSTNNGLSYFSTVYNLLGGALNQTPLWAQFPINALKIGLVTMPIYNTNTAFSTSGPPSDPSGTASASAVGSFLSYGSSVNAIRVSTSGSTFVNGSVIALVGRA